mmetsp:Transcript_18710/g.58014  ORF Transcript_18710/g.58014 Transcript_18710/m.58014 type:complete len:876 (-) Transcript_18710:286-2913(-)
MSRAGEKRSFVSDTRSLFGVVCNVLWVSLSQVSRLVWRCSLSEGALGEVVAEGAHDELMDRVGQRLVDELPRVLDDVAGLDEAVVDRAHGVQLRDHGRDLALVARLLLQDGPHVLAVGLVEARHGLDDGVRDLAVLDVLADLLEVALEAAQVERVVDDLEREADLRAEGLERVRRLGGRAADDARHGAERAGGAAGLVDVDRLQRVEHLGDVAGLDGLGHEVVQAGDVEALPGVAGAEDVEQQLVHLALLVERQLLEAREHGGHEVAHRAGVDRRGGAVLEVDRLSAAADDGLVLDVVDDQGADVEQLGHGDVVAAVHVILRERVHAAHENQRAPRLATAVDERAHRGEDGVADARGVGAGLGRMAAEHVLVHPLLGRVQRVHVRQGLLHDAADVLEEAAGVLVRQVVLALEEAGAVDGLALEGAVGDDAALVEAEAGDEDRRELLVLDGALDDEVEADGRARDLPLLRVLDEGRQGRPCVGPRERHVGDGGAHAGGVGEDGDLLLLAVRVAVDDVEERQLAVVVQLDREPRPRVERVLADLVLRAAELAVVPAAALDLVLLALDRDGAGDGHARDVVVEHLVDDAVQAVADRLAARDELQARLDVADWVVQRHLVDDGGRAEDVGLLRVVLRRADRDDALVVQVDGDLLVRRRDLRAGLHQAVREREAALADQLQQRRLDVLRRDAGHLRVKLGLDALRRARVEQRVGVVLLVVDLGQGPRARVEVVVRLLRRDLLLGERRLVGLREEGREEREARVVLLGDEVGVEVPPLEHAARLRLLVRHVVEVARRRGEEVLPLGQVRRVGRAVGRRARLPRLAVALALRLGGGGGGGGNVPLGLDVVSVNDSEALWVSVKGTQVCPWLGRGRRSEVVGV